MFLILLNILLICAYSYEFSYSNNNPLLTNHYYFKNYQHLLKNNNKLNLFYSLDNSFIKENLLKLNCYEQNLKYQSITYNDFLYECYDTDNDILYINDFLIDYGRIIHDKEKEHLLEFNEKSKIILNVEENSNLVLKDNNFLNKLEKIYFIHPNKRMINEFIFNLIEYYQYDNYLYQIDWSKYQLEKYSFEDIENIIYKVHLSYISKNNLKLNYINKLIINH